MALGRISSAVSGGEPAVEGDVEGLERSLPAHGPAFASGPGRVQAHHGQVDALEGGLVGGEVSPGPDGLADPRVDALEALLSIGSW